MTTKDYQQISKRLEQISKEAKAIKNSIRNTAFIFILTTCGKKEIWEHRYDSHRQQEYISKYHFKNNRVELIFD